MQKPVSVDVGLFPGHGPDTPKNTDPLLLFHCFLLWTKEKKRTIFFPGARARLVTGGNFLTILGGFVHEGVFLLLQRPPVGKEFTAQALFFFLSKPEKQ